MIGFLSNAADGVIIHVRVSANARKDSIEGTETRDDGKCYLKLKTRAIPEDGAANAAIIKFLAKSLGYPKSCLALISGEKAREKAILVIGAKADIEAQISNLLKTE